MNFGSLLDIGPEKEEQLTAALFTTYEPPDWELLCDRLLPALLAQPVPPPDSAEPSEKQRAWMNFCQQLSALKGKLVVVSSLGQGFGGYHWIQPYFRPFTVGIKKSAIQHAKLWMLVWRNGKGKERLEIVISSANLTDDSFKRQIQCAWRVSVRLAAQELSSGTNRTSWTDLPRFLDALSAHCDATNEISHFSALLSRAQCPKGVRFVATAPTDGVWGATSLRNALGQQAVSGIRILSPFTGNWTHKTLHEWLLKVGCTKGTIQLAAVPTGQTIPESTKWVLPKKTRDDLWAKEARGNSSPRFSYGLLTADPSKELRDGAAPLNDERWTHAKLYEFRLGQRSSILITSANFSPTAWGLNNSGNFELGVLLDKQRLPFALETATQLEQVQARGEAKNYGNGNFWADAVWDGQTVCVRVRGSVIPAIRLVPPKQSDRVQETTQAKSGLFEVRVCRTHPLPNMASVSCGNSRVNVPIIDLRESVDDLPVETLDMEMIQNWREQMLLEKYNFPYGDPPNRNSQLGKPNYLASNDSYEVAELSQSREWFNVVSAWQHKLDKEPNSKPLTDDGRMLLKLFRRRSDIDGLDGRIAGAVADELKVRLTLAKISYD